MSAQRKYALTKIGAGDYVFPANDKKTVWRIMVYEDGSSHGVESMSRDRMFWGVWKWNGDAQTLELDATYGWEMMDSGYETRRDAIQAALRMGEQ
ncbi:MAG: hypothetical protein WAU69_02460 [Solirubrobacteraceae bacterium]